MIICLHGFLGRADDWRRLPWPADCEIWPLDLWASFAQLRPRSLREWGAQLQLPAGAHAAVGYSMGGRLLLHALLEQPQAIRCAVVTSTHPGLVSSDERAVRLQRDREWQTALRTQAWPEFLGAWNQQPVLQTSPTWPLHETEFDREILAQVMEVASLGQQEDLRQLVPQDRVLWLTGARDDKFAQLTAEMGVRGHRTEIVTEAGHRVPWDQPAQFTQRVQNFVLWTNA